MISSEYFIELLNKRGTGFFSGVPDSLLRNLCAYITDYIDKECGIITVNEGTAIALAAGHYLATGKIPLVYMQNSGLGNAVNPLLSLVDKEIYNIPILLLIGWRGMPGVKDEPQHIKQGRVTGSLLDCMEIKHAVLAKDTDEVAGQIDDAYIYMQTSKEPFALIIEKDTFEDHTLQNNNLSNYEMTRERAIQFVVDSLNKDAVVVSTTGMISRELFEYREKRGQGHEHDFLSVGSMGHASHIALGIALMKKSTNVYCFDGDGAVLMHLGALATIGTIKPDNYIHIVFNNGAHDSVGGQPTVALNIDLCQVALSSGYCFAFSVEKETDLHAILNIIKEKTGPVFLEIKVRKGARNDLGRPTTTPVQNKDDFMDFLSRRI
ncbi:phosphonopyruvate decarboxylase [Spirochaetia bacterium]|nr:phosphonopyruvate decarboxylase [Spirochaetia bacterium]